MIYEDKKAVSQKKSNDLFLKIINALPVPVFYRDINDIYQACNTAFEKFIGLNSSKIIGKSVNDIHSKEVIDIFKKRDKELLENPGDQNYESRLRYSDGTMRNVVFNKAVIINDAGDTSGIVCSIFDITERKRAENKLERAEEAMIISSHMLHKINAGVIIVNDDMKVIDSNEYFAKLMGDETAELYETIPGLRGAEVKELIPETIYKMITNILSSGENKFERDIKYQNRRFHVLVVTIYKNRVIGVVIRDMSAPMLARDEIINRARKVNRKNIETVQKVAFLLGENAAQTEELLNSIIESYRYGDDE